MSDEERIYDVAVCGGGVVGLAAALALAADGRRVALIERQPPVRQRGRLGFDGRSLALTPAAVDFLRTVGDIDEAELGAINAMRVWEHDGAAALHFSASEPLAWVVENSALTTRLWRCAAERVTLVAPAELSALGIQRQSVVLSCRGGERIEARLVVAADGANSPVRSLAAARYASRRRRHPVRNALSLPWRVCASRIATRLGSVSAPPGRSPCYRSPTLTRWRWSGAARQRWWNVLKAWTTTRFGALWRPRWSTSAAASTRWTDASPSRCGSRWRMNSTPRRASFWPAMRRERCIRLAGQGVNIGLEDARALAAAARGGDLGEAKRWRSYARARRQRSKMMLALMRSLLNAYCGANAGGPWRRLLRNTGVRFIDSSAAIKAQLVREAMGLGPLAVS